MKHKELLRFLKANAPLPLPGELWSRWCSHCAALGLDPGNEAGFTERVGNTMDRYLGVRAGHTRILPNKHSR